jgi:hypothetical protein
VTTRSVFWRGLEWLSLEHLTLVEGEGRADGLILGEYEGRPFHLRYGIAFDQGWATRRVAIEDEVADARLDLARTDEGWHHADGRALPEVGDAVDVDIAATPFTNTLPIRRLGLEPGGWAEIDVVYLSVFPELAVSGARQRYTRLEDARYRYESVDSGFTADLPIDADGLVLDYPGLWERVSP